MLAVLSINMAYRPGYMNFELKQTASEIDNSKVPRFIFHEIQRLNQKLPESKHSNGPISDENTRKPLGKCSANNVTSSLSGAYSLFACGNGLLQYVAKSTISPSSLAAVRIVCKNHPEWRRRIEMNNTLY